MAHYVKGKWYKCISWSSPNDFCKAINAPSDSDLSISYSERIYDKKYEKSSGSWGRITYAPIEEASYEEYSKFLPSDHPDLIRTESSFVGRYIKALQDNAHGTTIKKDNYYRVLRDDGKCIITETPSGTGQFTYKTTFEIKTPYEALKNRGVELMPVGFTPPFEEEKKTSTDFEMIHGNWYTIVNLDDRTGGKYIGIIGHVFQYDKNVSSTLYGASTATTCPGVCWAKENLRPATESEIAEAKRKYFPDSVEQKKEEKKEESMITLDSYDGYIVGSTLYASDLSKWVNSTGKKNYYTDGLFKQTDTAFIGDRTVVKIAMIQDTVCFLVSNTIDVWIVAEGYAAFVTSSFSRSTVSSEQHQRIITLSISNYGGISVGESLDKEIVNTISDISGNQFWNSSPPAWKVGGGSWMNDPKVIGIVSIDGHVCYNIGTSPSDFYIKADALLSAYKEHASKMKDIYDLVHKQLYSYTDSTPPSYIPKYPDDDGLEFHSPIIVKKSTKKPKLVIL